MAHLQRLNAGRFKTLEWVNHWLHRADSATIVLINID
jgi:hypothetical protein